MYLTSKQLIQLSATIPVHEMIKIGEGYLNLEYTLIQNIVFDNKHSQAITREILRAWCYKNHMSDQTEVSANIICYFKLLGTCINNKLYNSCINLIFRHLQDN